MTRVTFPKISRRVVRLVRCQICGKTVERQTTLYQTINPWNKDSDGRVKTASIIYNELDKLAIVWQPDNPRCKGCAQREAAR